MIEKDFFIAGGGLAGLTLAYRLTECCQASIVMVDDEHPCAASRIAAGLINPITGRRHVKTRMADTLIPVAFKFYRHLESLTGLPIIKPMPIAVIYDSIKTRNDWLARSAEKGYENYIDRELSPGELCPAVRSPYGGIVLKQSAAIDVPNLLSALKHLLTQRHVMFITDVFNPDEFRFDQHYAEWKNIRARRVIFCEGWKMTTNPWFSHHPMKPVKGELLLIECPELTTDYILMKDVFLCPVDANRFLAGSTYEWNFTGSEPSQQAREKLEKSIRQLLTVRFHVVGHHAAIRPAMEHRWPVAAMHPIIRQAAVFNGLGTKGFLLAPYFSEKLAEELIRSALSADNKQRRQSTCY
jgi:glycine/D-amino acid oxidase-like deaminating enzyme